jgi:hypothetical protein
MNAIPSQIFVLVNHTEIGSKDIIFESSTGQKFDDILNGITQLSFKMNHSLISKFLEEISGNFWKKEFVFFANFQGPLLSSNFTTFPKHTSRSEVAIYFDFMKPLSKNELGCEKTFNLTGRLLARNWIGYLSATLISIIIILLFIIFRNDQPLKSRYFSPVAMILTLFINLAAEYVSNILEYEKNIRIFCIIDGFSVFPSVQLAALIPSLTMFRYAVMLQLHLRKREFIKTTLKKSKVAPTPVFFDVSSKIQKSIENPRIKVVYNFFRKILIILKSKWVFILIPILWISFFMLGIFIIFSLSGFTCQSWTFVYMRYFHSFGLIICALNIVFFYLFDAVMSFRNCIKCQCNQYWIKDDPFHSRMENGIILLFFPLVVLWGIGNPVPFFFQTILSDLLFFLGFLMGGGIALLITLVYKIIQSIKSRNMNEKWKKVTLSAIMDDEFLLDKFIQFSEGEWNSENIYFKLDAIEYIKMKDLNSKKNIALKIKENYLLVNVSPCELNARGNTLNEILKKIEENNFRDDLFENLIKEVDLNIQDVLARFEFSTIYIQWITRKDISSILL